MYKRKTIDIWEIRGNYGYGMETLSAYKSRSEAIADLRAYRENQPAHYILVKTREKILCE